MNARPTLNDPKEWAIVRRMYFKEPSLKIDKEDELERLDRMQRKDKQLKNQTR